MPKNPKSETIPKTYLDVSEVSRTKADDVGEVSGNSLGVSHLLCPVTGMTNAEKAILKKTWWKMVGKNPDDLSDLAVKFMLWLTNYVPHSMARLSSEGHDSNLTAHLTAPFFLAHGQSVILTLDGIVHSLRQPENLHMRLHKIALNHLKLVPPVDLTFFRPLRDNFHVFIMDELNVSDESDEVEAWMKLINALIRVFIEQEEANKLNLTKQKQCHCCNVS